ncbi:MAG: class I tRNA ligase family protein, partial [Nanoarchaeota archaeon]|nr:class I tRNA ligase family protein [Nanoarchaeota archaeon]
MSDNKFEYEENILEFWDKNKIYDKVQKKNKGNKPFNHVDGPPFPTGEPHVGHFRNWAIKDSVLRFKRLQGYDVYARDGYDVHGLPVENKVQERLGFKEVNDLKEFGEENFVKECKKYVKEVIDNMTQRRERYGLWMERDYYHTSHPEYLSLSWKFFKKAHEKGLLYKDYKTVAWSPALETTLSDYEIKDHYTTLEDPSIYVKFKVKKESTKSNYDEYLVIWTTTPWTLQSNLAIAVNPDFEYSRVLVDLNGNKEVLILATNLIEKCLNIFSKKNKIKLIEVLDRQKGSDLEGTKYEHILLEETPSQKEFLNSNNQHIHSVILADYVTLGEGEDILEKLEKKGYKHSHDDKKEDTQKTKEKEENTSKQDGTGLVHIAPGHGFEDYEAGKKYNLPIFSPVDTRGHITEGLVKGKHFRDANQPVMDNLESKNILLSSKMKSHRYPCCWRSKVPIVYRATEQWYIKRSAIIKDIIKENSNVNWFPNFAKSTFNNLMENAGDWAISRQRFWGIPLPVFEDEDGNIEVFGSKEELEKRIGKKLPDIHRDDLKGLEIKHKDSGKIAKPVPYIADVWFDSGCASFASHYGEGLSFDEIIKKYYPMKWITEGQDQIRGWFSSLFNVGLMVTGKAPYNQVLFQQFVMAKDGSKMSKSLGNGVDGLEAIERWGSDKTRYYLLTKSVPEQQINFDVEEFTLVDGFFNTLENLSKFMNNYLKDYTLSHPVLNMQNLDVEDLWILGQLNKTIQTFTLSMDNYRLNVAFKTLEDFIVKDLSKTYLKIVKERSEERDENLLIIFEKILKEVLIMLAPASPFKAEELYQSLDFSLKKESIFLEDMPEVDKLIIKEIEKKGIDENFELSQDIIQAVLNAREKVKIGVRWPLSEINIISTKSLSETLKPFEKLIKKITNILKISYSLDDLEVSYNIKPNFKNIK